MIGILLYILARRNRLITCQTFFLVLVCRPKMNPSPNVESNNLNPNMRDLKNPISNVVGAPNEVPRNIADDVKKICRLRAWWVICLRFMVCDFFLFTLSSRMMLSRAELFLRPFVFYVAVVDAMLDPRLLALLTIKTTG